MGDIADYYRDEMDEAEEWEHFSSPPSPPRPISKEEEDFALIREKVKWTTRMGDKVLLTQMTNTHLENAHRMVVKNNSNSQWPNILSKEILFRSLNKIVI